MSSIIDVLLFEAALFILAVTGCFVYGVVSQAFEDRRERQRRELEAMSDELLNEMRKAQAFVQVANGDCNANVIGSNNVVNCGCNDNGEWEEERFYSDNTLYLVMRKPKVPDACGTDEGK